MAVGDIDLWATVDPEEVTADELRSRDEAWPESCFFARWVAVSGERLVGLVQILQPPYQLPDPQVLRPPHGRPGGVGKGLGSRLFQLALDRLATLEELQAEPGWLDRLHALETACLRDVPFTEPIRVPTREELEDQVRTDGSCLPCTFVAVDPTGSWLGYSRHRPIPAKALLHVEMTGVRDGSRRAGIATTLKLEGIDHARRNGFEALTAACHSVNEPMLRLNERLGSVRRAARVTMVRRFR